MQTYMQMKKSEKAEYQKINWPRNKPYNNKLTQPVKIYSRKRIN